MRMDLQAALGKGSTQGYMIGITCLYIYMFFTYTHIYNMLPNFTLVDIAFWGVHRGPGLEANLLAWATEIFAVSPIGVTGLRLEDPAFMNMKVPHSTPKNIRARKL